MDYVVVVQAPAYSLSPTTFAIESAFAEHLRELRRSIGSRFSRIVVIAPALSAITYEAKKHHLGTLDLECDEVMFIPAYPETTSALSFWLLHAHRVWRTLSKAMRSAAIVQSGLCTDLWRPFMAMANFVAWKAGRRVIFIVDIDFRKHTERLHHLGYWSFRSYLINRIVHDPFKWLQVWLAVRMLDLVMLKSISMVRDFHRGSINVKNFYDTVHSESDILAGEQIERRLAWLRDPRQRLRLCYFGRLVPNKGLDRVIEALRLARDQDCDVQLRIIGDGPCLNALRRQSADAGLLKQVEFRAQVPYGERLFEQLRDVHLTVAAPLIEDTPRAAFDSMARGVPVLAFDISYFRDIADACGAVALATWPDASAIAHQLVSLSRNRDRLAEMALNGLAFARNNTQQTWLKRRVEWMEDMGVAEEFAMSTVPDVSLELAERSID